MLRTASTIHSASCTSVFRASHGFAMLGVGYHQCKEADPVVDTPASTTRPCSPCPRGYTALATARPALPTDPLFPCGTCGSLCVVVLPRSYSDTRARKRRCTSMPAHRCYITSLLMCTAPFSSVLFFPLCGNIPGGVCPFTVYSSCSPVRLWPVRQHGVVRPDTSVPFPATRWDTVQCWSSSLQEVTTLSREPGFKILFHREWCACGA
jgi:hypothetical protein